MFAKLAGTAVIGWFCVVSWVILSRVSADALALGLGVTLGIGAGIPVALLLLASQRRAGPPPAPPAVMQQPPVIVIAPPHQGGTLPPERWVDGPRPALALPTWNDAEELDEWGREEW